MSYTRTFKQLENVYSPKIQLDSRHKPRWPRNRMSETPYVLRRVTFIWCTREQARSLLTAAALNRPHNSNCQAHSYGVVALSGVGAGCRFTYLETNNLRNRTNNAVVIYCRARSVCHIASECNALLFLFFSFSLVGCWWRAICLYSRPIFTRLQHLTNHNLFENGHRNLPKHVYYSKHRLVWMPFFLWKVVFLDGGVRLERHPASPTWSSTRTG